MKSRIHPARRSPPPAARWSGANPDYAVAGFEMPGGVPGQRRHPVAEPDAVPLEALGDLEGAVADVRIGGGLQRTFHRTRMDAALRMVQRGMIDDAMAQ